MGFHSCVVSDEEVIFRFQGLGQSSVPFQAECKIARATFDADAVTQLERRGWFRRFRENGRKELGFGWYIDCWREMESDALASLSLLRLFASCVLVDGLDS